MAQIGLKIQIVGQPLVNGASWTAVVNPLSECRGVRIFNPDLVSPLYLCTDTADVNSVQAIAAGADVFIEMSSKYVRSIGRGETVVYLKGGGVTPIVNFTV